VAGMVQAFHATESTGAVGNGRYIPALGAEGRLSQDTAEIGHGRGYAPFGGTVRSVYGKNRSNPGGDHVYTLKKNNVDVAGAALTLNGSTVLSVTGLSATFVENDYLSWLVTDVGVVDVSACITLVYEPDSAYYAIGGSSENLTGALVHYFEFGHVEDAQVSLTESDVWVILGAPFTIAGLTVRVSSAPAAGQTVAFEYYDNGVPTGVSVLLTSADTLKTTGVQYEALAGSKMSLKKTSSVTSYNPSRVWWYSRGLGRAMRSGLVRGQRVEVVWHPEMSYSVIPNYPVEV
jgi:hypothetical protein